MWSKKTFKLSKGGRCLVDFDPVKKELLIESFLCIEDLFEKKDKDGNLFGSVGFKYRLLKVQGL